MRQGLELDGGGINERIGPGELELVQPFAEREMPSLFYEREVNRIINRELNRVAFRQRYHIDARLRNLPSREREGETHDLPGKIWMKVRGAHKSNSQEINTPRVRSLERL